MNSSKAPNLETPSGAKIIIDIVRLEEPPLRLLLASDAVRSAEESSKARAAEAEHWAEVSRSADYPSNE